MPATTSADPGTGGSLRPPSSPASRSRTRGDSDPGEGRDPSPLIRALRRRRRLRIRLLVADARAMAALTLGDGHQELGFASVGELAESLGWSATEGRTLRALGRALEGWPGLEERLLDGRLNPDKAAAMARLLEVQGALRPGEGPVPPAGVSSTEPAEGPISWLAAAEEDATLDFQRRVARRCEEALRGVPVERLSFLVSQAGLADFRRCRGLVSSRANRRFSRGETLEILAARYLEGEDPLLVRGRPRRAGAPGGDGGGPVVPGRPDSPGRHVRAEVRRAVLARAGARCEFPRCGFDTWLELAHVVAHRHGGSREADNLVLLCGVHHRALDGGILEARFEEGTVFFRNPWGEERAGPRLRSAGTGPGMDAGPGMDNGGAP